MSATKSGSCSLHLNEVSEVSEGACEDRGRGQGPHKGHGVGSTLCAICTTRLAVCRGLLGLTTIQLSS